MNKIQLDVSDGSIVTQNIDSNIIVIREEKIENILLKYLEILSKQRQWTIPVSLLLTVCITLATAEFNKDFLGIQPSLWKSCFMVSFIILSFWSIIAIVNAIIYKIKLHKKTPVEFIIEQFFKNRSNK